MTHIVNNSKTFPRRNYISHIFIVKKIKHSMGNDILKVIKEQNLGALENFGFEKKNGDRKIQNFE